MIIGGV